MRSTSRCPFSNCFRSSLLQDKLRRRRQSAQFGRMAVRKKTGQRCVPVRQQTIRIVNFIARGGQDLIEDFALLVAE